MGILTTFLAELEGLNEFMLCLCLTVATMLIFLQQLFL